MDGIKRMGTLSALLAGVVLLAGAATASAQAVYGALTGTTVDNVGVVPGATVTATQVSTNAVRTAVSNDQGVFRIPSLPPGRYRVKVEMDGFKPVSIEEFNLLAGELRDLGKLTLSAGGVSESVTITAEVTPVQTASSQLTKNITGDTLVSVQVKGRDIFGMMKILPGVVDTTANRDYAAWSSGRGLSINGGNSLNKNTTIDGVPVGEEGGDGTTHITPNIDAIGEVNVITSGYTAENGRQSSGLISIVTKSGTNQFRGSGWYNFRDDSMNKNRVPPHAQQPAEAVLPREDRRLQYRRPNRSSPDVVSRTSQKKMYFFLSQEFTQDVRPTATSRTNLPTDLERNGNFSQSFYGKATLQPDGSIIGDKKLDVINDPLTGAAFPGNVIPANRINATGQAMLKLLPLPNNTYDYATNAYWTSNDAQDRTPLHDRSNFVARVDVVLSQNIRFSGKVLFDRDNSQTYNRVAPGIGSVNNVFPGDLYTGSMSQVITPNMVNEVTAGFSHNHWGFRIGKGAQDWSQYTAFYRQNLGVDPPRLQPFGEYRDPPVMDRSNLDQYPYMAEMNFGAGNRTNLINYRPSGGSGPLPRWNENFRYTFQDDLSYTKGRHNLKFGFFTERDSKTEPGSVGYAGQFNFGHNADNPLSTGNGYANVLLGAYTSYTELTARVDQENRHWQSDAYAQDSWRINSRMTLDYGIRVTHAGAVYESRNQNSGFDPALWSSSQAPVLYRPACTTGVAGDQPCAATNRRAIDPRFPTVFLSQAYVAKTVPGTGTILNGMFTNGMANNPANPQSGVKDGWYYDMPALSWGPRVGFAWDVFGDGKTAIRASGGIFYNFINRSQYLYNGGPLISRTRTILNGTLDDITALAKQGASAAFAENPATANLPGGLLDPKLLRGQQLPQGKLEPEKNYQANVAFQRDLGFNTVAEIAYVTNIGRHFWRVKTANNIPINSFADVNNLFRNEKISDDLLRQQFPGTGSVRYLTTNDDVLNYNAVQMSVQRRLTKGLQMGLAYTYSKALGIKGWDFMTEELGGKQAIRNRYYGPPSASQEQDRRHIMTINYSYQVPNPTPNTPVLKAILSNWEASGVIQYMTGNALDPVCNTSLAGVTNADPSLTNVATRCELTGQSISAVTVPDPSAPFAFQPHFNLGAFQRPLPSGGQGNLGNAPLGVLRHPNWQNWDFTMARRIPVSVGRGGSVRVQFQLYNMWNQVQFTTMAATYRFTTGQGTGNDNTQTGQYTATTNPLNAGITIRFDY